MDHLTDKSHLHNSFDAQVSSQPTLEKDPMLIGAVHPNFIISKYQKMKKMGKLDKLDQEIERRIKLRDL